MSVDSYGSYLAPSARLSRFSLRKMMRGQKIIDFTPEEFEEAVKLFLHVGGVSLHSFDTRHREKIGGSDGTYEIDVTARFRALGVDFLVLIECKKQTRPVKREVIQVLFDRIRAVGANKGIVFSTGGYQSGAIRYATDHGIALIDVAPGHRIYEVSDLHSACKALVFSAGKLSFWNPRIEDGREIYAAIIVKADFIRTLQV